MGEERVQTARRLASETVSRSERKNAAGLATKLRIMDVAEKLFADRGIDAVSVNDIRIAAELSNNSAIQYHFGSKWSLVRAILDVRLSEIERIRSSILEEMKNSGREGDVRALLEALFRPKMELVDDEGCNTFAKFMLEVKTRYLEEIQNPLYEEPGAAVFINKRISTLLQSAIPEVSEGEARFRVRALIHLFDVGLVERDALWKRGEEVPPRETLMQWALEMGAAALVAAPSQSSNWRGGWGGSSPA